MLLTCLPFKPTFPPLLNPPPPTHTSDNVRATGRVSPYPRGDLFMVFEYMDHDLAGLINAGYEFSLRQIRCLTHQLLEVLDYLHNSKKIMHRDIKCSNLLVGKNMQLKLADFGLARFATREDGRYTNRVITLWYRPPELLLGETKYNNAVDVWSVGCILAELLLGSPAFQAKKEFDQLEEIWKVCGTPTPDNWPAHTALPQWGNPYQLTTEYPDKNRMRSEWSGKVRRRLDSYLTKYGPGAGATDPTAAAERSVDHETNIAMGLLSKLLHINPSRRCDARAAKRDVFFTCDPDSLHWQNLKRPGAAESGEIDTGGVSFHEWETKLMIKEALASGLIHKGQKLLDRNKLPEKLRARFVCGPTVAGRRGAGGEGVDVGGGAGATVGIVAVRRPPGPLPSSVSKRSAVTAPGTGLGSELLPPAQPPPPLPVPPPPARRPALPPSDQAWRGVGANDGGDASRSLSSSGMPNTLSTSSKSGKRSRERSSRSYSRSRSRSRDRRDYGYYSSESGSAQNSQADRDWDRDRSGRDDGDRGRGGYSSRDYGDSSGTSIHRRRQGTNGHRLGNTSSSSSSSSSSRDYRENDRNRDRDRGGGGRDRRSDRDWDWDGGGRDRRSDRDRDRDRGGRERRSHRDRDGDSRDRRYDRSRGRDVYSRDTVGRDRAEDSEKESNSSHGRFDSTSKRTRGKRDNKQKQLMPRQPYQHHNHGRGKGKGKNKHKNSKGNHVQRHKNNPAR